MSGGSDRDIYSAVWVSHSSMGDFLKCPRCYYLHNVYKDPRTRRKISIVSPNMSLGSAVHEVVESLASLPAASRKDHLSEDILLASFEKAWKKVSGKKGGFTSAEEEEKLKERGRNMILRVARNPGPLLEKTVRFRKGENIPHFFLSEKDNLILCGKIDWLIHKPADDSVHVLDFKTGKHEEKGDSLQLPIYQLLLKNLQKRKVSGASYWYFEKDDAPMEIILPDEAASYEKVLSVAGKVGEARSLALIHGPEKVFVCPRGGSCYACEPFEKIIRGSAEHVGTDEMRRDLYLVKSKEDTVSEI
jgi:ATP-dependent helicase/DNAse subunit B